MGNVGIAVADRTFSALSRKGFEKSGTVEEEREGVDDGVNWTGVSEPNLSLSKIEV